MDDHRRDHFPARFLIGAAAAALMLAGCAGTPNVTREVSSAPGEAPKFSQAGNVNIAYANFTTSAFPYHGLVPTKDKPEGDTPFIDTNYDGRLGHSSPRGGVYFEDTTYSDRSVLLAAPTDFDASQPAAMVVFFHGNQATLSRDVVDRQQAARQFADSNLNGVLVAPQLAVDALDSSAGRFWQPGALAQFLDEAAGKLAKLYPNAPHGAFHRMPVILVAYSGGYLPAAYALAHGGAGERVHGVVLFDALYGEEDKFLDWIESAHNHAFFVSAYSKSSHDENEALRERLAKEGIETMSAMPDHLRAGTIAFIDAGDVKHEDFVNLAWTSDPLRDVLSRVSR
jgi:hypothetical protein